MHTAVLLLIFNRPGLTADVIKRLEEVRPPRLYVAADGPRHSRVEDFERCKAARQVAISVNWPCEVITLFRDSNLGCKLAVSTAIDWFFEHEEVGIILEDDCVPHIDFFKYCEHGLIRYRDDHRVYAITGDNFQDGMLRGEPAASYYFSKYPHCWGWATWRRAWKAYDGEMNFWGDFVSAPAWQALHSDATERKHWEQLALQVRSGSLDSWATPWMFSVWFYSGLTMTPNVNLVENVGFGADATHTFNKRDVAAQLQVRGLGNLRDAANVALDFAADRYVFINHFGGRNLIFPRNMLLAAKRKLAPIVRRILHFFGATV